MIQMEILKIKIIEGIRRIPDDQKLMLNKEKLKILESLFLEALSADSLNLNDILHQVNRLKEKETFLNKVPEVVLDTIKPYFHSELNSMLPLFFEPEEGQEEVTEQDLKELFHKLLITQLNKLLTRHEFESEPFLFEYKRVKCKNVKSLQFSVADQRKAEEDDAKPTL